jgi:hypothetical protein
VKDPAKTINDRFKYEYARLLQAISDFSVGCGVSGIAAVTRAAAGAATIADAFLSSKSGYASKDNADRTISGMNWAKDGVGVDKVTPILAKALWTYTKQVTSSAISLKGFDGNYTTLMKARGLFIHDYTEGVDVAGEVPAAAWFFTDEEPTEQPDYTPIFPVSDRAGYEVYGNLPYGRGVTIEKYKELLGSTTTGEDIEDGPEAAEKSITLVGTSGGANASSMIAIEKFFAIYFQDEDEGKALGAISGPEQASVLAGLNTTAEGLKGVVEALLNQDTSSDAKVRNSPVTSFFRGQSIFGDKAAAQLANLEAGHVICVCKGVEQTFFLQAFSQEFVALFDDPVQGFAELQAFNISEAYKGAKDAMAGRTLDVRNSTLAEEFEAQGLALESNANVLAESLRQAGEDTRTAAEQAADNFKDLADLPFDNEIEG